MRDTDIPISVTNDEIMASATEIKWLMDWAKKAFGGETCCQCCSSKSLIKSTSFPFSFKYNGLDSAAFLSEWKHTFDCKDTEDRVLINAEWVDPKTGLAVIATVMVFKEYPAVDWVLNFENRGSSDTPIIEDVQTCNIVFDTADRTYNPIVHELHGDSCGERSFAPHYTELFWPGQYYRIAPLGGRPSNGTAFPFFNFEFGNTGIITAIGWSGQWAASYKKSDDWQETSFQAGMELCHLLLHPGENIRTPRVMFMTWSGDRVMAHNRFRRLMMYKYVPKINGRAINMPVCLQTFDLYHNMCLEHLNAPQWSTEAGQFQAVEAAHKLGCDTYWLDAAWFVGDFPNGVGNWYCKPNEFSNGLKPITDLAHSYNMKFILWFEPCRVAKNTQIANEHQEWLLGDPGNQLYNLGDPDARKWMTDLLSTRISEFGLDVYREDYNIDPLDFWRANDTPDRQGMTEIRFVEGHYAMWDELRERHPGLWIDNCASGGRRIDLETCSRSVPLWRSDTSCFAGHPEWNQMQSAALSLYVPLHTACGWSYDAYTLRSSATSGMLCQLPYMEEGFDFDAANKAIAEADENRKYWYGDFYPLTGTTYTIDDFIAYQFHRTDLNAGVAYAFRRQNCLFPGITISLQGLDMESSYKVTMIDENREIISEETRTGANLYNEGIEIKIPKRSSLLIRYSQVP